MDNQPKDEELWCVARETYHELAFIKDNNPSIEDVWQRVVDRLRPLIEAPLLAEIDDKGDDLAQVSRKLEAAQVSITDLKFKLAAATESADFAWKNTNIIEKERHRLDDEFRAAQTRIKELEARLAEGEKHASDEPVAWTKHDLSVIADLEIMAADPNNGFWPCALAIAALRMIGTKPAKPAAIPEGMSKGKLKRLVTQVFGEGWYIGRDGFQMFDPGSMQLMPKEPTKAIVNVMIGAYHQETGGGMYSAYRAALAAAQGTAGGNLK